MSVAFTQNRTGKPYHAATFLNKVASCQKLVTNPNVYSIPTIPLHKSLQEVVLEFMYGIG